MNRTIRWVCWKCNYKWVQPVEKCVYCKGKTEKEIGRKLKVIGFTNVKVQSVMHPIVPYNIILLEDEHGNRMPKKTLKEYKIGDSYEVVPSKDEHAVSITKIKYDFDEAVDEALWLIGGIDVDKSKRILIKPSIMASSYPYLGAVTNPKVVSGLIDYLVLRGAAPENIVVAEQCLYNKMDDALGKSGFGELCKEKGVRFVDIQKSDFEEIQVGQMKVKVSTLVKENDLIINVPVLKTHLIFGIAGALENMSRFVSVENLMQMQVLAQSKAIDMNEAIVQLGKALPKYITLGDGSVGMQGNGPLNGEPAFLNYLLASRDCVSHDAVFAALGMFVRKPKFLEIAEKEGLGIAHIDKIPVVGNELNAVSKEIKPATGSLLIKGM